MRLPSLTAAALVAAMLAACSPEADPEANPGDEQLSTLPAEPGAQDATPPASVAPAPATLSGHWRVAGIDGEPFDEPYGLALVADEDRIWWEPTCAGGNFSYTIDGNSFAAIAYTDPAMRPVPGEPPPPVCAIAFPPRLSEVFRAIQSADRIEITPENGVLISGGGHSLVMFSQ